MNKIFLKNALKKALKHTIYTKSYNVYLEDNHFIAKSYDYGYYNDSIVEDLFRKRLNDIEKTILFPLEIDNILSKSDADLINANTIDVGNQKVLTPILHR